MNAKPHFIYTNPIPLIREDREAFGEYIIDKLDKAQSQAAVSQIIRDINEGERTD